MQGETIYWYFALGRWEKCWLLKKLGLMMWNKNRLFLGMSLLSLLGSPLGCMSIKELDLKERDGGSDDTDTPDSCSGVSCYAPPDNECAGVSGVEVHSRSGFCSEGKCVYSAHEEKCETGDCEQGE